MLSFPSPSGRRDQMTAFIGRREFITLLGGAAAAWPLAARAQQGDRVRHIGVLLAFDENDPGRPAPRSRKRSRAWVGPMAATCGWTSVRRALTPIGYERSRRSWSACNPTSSWQAGARRSLPSSGRRPTIPIVFVAGDDAVASGFVPRLDRPSGNVTGFSSLEATLGGKWLELLLEIAPGLNAPQSCSIPTPPLHRLLCPHLRRRPSHSRSRQSLRPFIANEKSKRPSSPLGASREAALSSCRMCSRSDIARR